MGDRGNIRVTDAHSSVYIYTHWGGSRLPVVAQRALKQDRNRDTAYLARIVFSQMLLDTIGLDGQYPPDDTAAGKALIELLRDSTGYGIAAYPPDNEHPVVHLNTELQTVSYEENGEVQYSVSMRAYTERTEDELLDDWERR